MLVIHPGSSPGGGGHGEDGECSQHVDSPFMVFIQQQEEWDGTDWGSGVPPIIPAHDIEIITVSSSLCLPICKMGTIIYPNEECVSS